LGRAAAGLHISDRETHVFQTQGTQGLEAEHVADQGGQHVNHGTFFEQVDRISYERIEAGIIARYIFDAVSTAFVVIQIGQQIGPYVVQVPVEDSLPRLLQLLHGRCRAEG